MSTIATVPDVAASAPTSVETSAPVSAPETSSPDTSSSSSRTAPETGSSYKDFDGPEDFLDSKLKEFNEKNKTAPEVGEVEEVDAEAEPEVGAADEENPAETETTEQTEPVEELEDGVLLGPKEFAKALNEDPAAKAFFDGNPELRNKVFAALRRDSENREIRQYFPDAASAKEAAQTAAQFGDLDQKFMSATTPEGAQSFMQSWYEMALKRDDAGNPIKNATGGYEVEPQWNNVNQHIFDQQLNFIADKAKNDDNAELSAALDIIREVITGSSRPKEDELPAHLKAQADSVQAREEALNRAERERSEKVNTEAFERVADQTTAKTETLLKPVFDKAGLTKFERTAATTEIDNRVIEKLKENPLYLSTRGKIAKQPPSEARDKQLLAHDMKYINQYLGPIAAAVVTEAKSGAIQRQDDKQEKINSQIAASKTEPRGTSANAAPQKALDPKVVKAQLQKEYADSHGGESMPAEDLIQKVLERTAAQARTRGRV